MNETIEYQKFLNKFKKDLSIFPFFLQSKIKQKVFSYMNQILKKKIEESFYGKKGAQLFELNPRAYNYIKISNQGIFTIDKMALQKTKQGHDKYNTDFINYDSIPGINNKEDLKYNMALKTDFENSNVYLYTIGEQNRRQEEILKSGLLESQIFIQQLIDECVSINKKNKKRRDG